MTHQRPIDLHGSVSSHLRAHEHMLTLANDVLVVIAIFHCRRRPADWQDRLARSRSCRADDGPALQRPSRRGDLGGGIVTPCGGVIEPGCSRASRAGRTRVAAPMFTQPA
jgi:hypothetical protein